MNKAFLTVVSTPLLYIFAVAMLAPPLALAVYYQFAPDVTFGKVVSKSGLALLVLGMIPISRALKLTTVELGFCSAKGKLISQICVGLFAGCLIMALVSTVLTYLEVRVIDAASLDSASHILKTLLGALVTGLLVAVVEETVFRGTFLAALTIFVPRFSAICISALYFAALHFFRGPTPTGEIGWFSGYRYVAGAFANIFQWQNLDTFLALFLAGSLLGYIRLARHPGIGYCIGLHAGWVFLIKITKAFTDSGSDSHWLFLVGDLDGVTGLFSALCLAIVIAIMIRLDSGSGVLRQTNRNQAP